MPLTRISYSSHCLIVFYFRHSSSLHEDEGEETLKMRNIDNKFASYEMRKDEIKEYLVNTSMNQGMLKQRSVSDMFIVEKTLIISATQRFIYFFTVVL
ncbi:uncharacterized protein [Solanum lycopersicum]|uniref:uncharacterized protein isoform X2 n=1 Tax=Solanum lycopersicum TaxID=4081 RepID=UPI003748D4F6